MNGNWQKQESQPLIRSGITVTKHMAKRPCPYTQKFHRKQEKLPSLLY